MGVDLCTQRAFTKLMGTEACRERAEAIQLLDDARTAGDESLERCAHAVIEPTLGTSQHYAWSHWRELVEEMSRQDMLGPKAIDPQRLWCNDASLIEPRSLRRALRRARRARRYAPCAEGWTEFLAFLERAQKEGGVVVF